MMSIDWSRSAALLRARALLARVRGDLRRVRPQVRLAKRRRAAFYARVWTDAARAVGASATSLGGGRFAITRGEARVIVRDNYTTLDDAGTLKRAGDKLRVHELLLARGVSTPAFARFSLASLAEAEAFLDSQDGPCVVKPARSTGAGQGITTGITDRADLAAAAADASRYGHELVIEREVAGANYRLLFLDGRLVDAVEREPPTVSGDGRSTIAQLVRAENRRRTAQGWVAAQVPLSRDGDMARTLERQHLSLQSVPEAGRRVTVKTVINDNAADETRPVAGPISDALVAECAAAAAAVGVRLAGVDVIVADVTRPLRDTGGVILEVNTTPGLYHHKRGERCPVAADLLERMLQEAEPTAGRPGTAGVRDGVECPAPGPAGRKADPPPVVVIGGGANALSIARNLGRRGIKVFAINKLETAVCYSRFAERLPAPTPTDYPRAWAQYLLGPEAAWLQGAVLLAASDVGIQIIARHRDELARRFRLDLSSPQAQLEMLDKLTTYRAAAAAGVDAPRFWEAESLDDLEAVREELVYPLLIKPKLSHTFTDRFKGKYFTAADFDELIERCRTLTEAGVPFVLVERIPGADDRLCSYYTYLDEAGVPQLHFTKRIIRRFPASMGLASYHITDWIPEARDAALALFQHVGLRGIAMAEFLRDERDGRLKLIECNARFTEADPLITRSGIDLASFVYDRIVGLPRRPPTRYRLGLRLWSPTNDFRAFCELRGRGELSVIGWLRSLCHRQTLPLFSWSDPLPSLGVLLRGMRKTVRRPASAGAEKAASTADLTGTFADHVRTRAFQYFPELVDSAAPALTVEPAPPVARRMSSLYAFRVSAGTQVRDVLVKVNRLRPDTAHRRAVQFRRDDRPRLARWMDPDQRAGHELLAQREIDRRFTALGDPRFTTVRVLDYLPAHRAVVMERLPAPDLSRLYRDQSRLRGLFHRRDLDRAFRNAGAWLRHYHRLPSLPHTEGRPAVRAEFVRLLHELASFDARAGTGFGRYEALARRADALVARALPAVLPVGLGHSDFAPRNVLVDDDDRVAGIDTSSAWRVPIYEDLGNFVSALSANRWGAPTLGWRFSRRTIERYERQFLVGYFEQRDIPYAAIRLFQLLLLLDQRAMLVQGWREARGWRRWLHAGRLWLSGPLIAGRAHRLIDDAAQHVRRPGSAPEGDGVVPQSA